MKSWAVPILAAVVAVVALAQDENKGDCDLSRVEDGLYCETCKAILEGDAIVDEEYCKKCSEDKEPEERKKAKCVKVCVKTYYQATCHPDKKSAEPGSCCGNEMEEKTSKALVVYKCEGCGKEADKEGDCANDGCKEDGKKCKAVCSSSGKFPHVKGK